MSGTGLELLIGALVAGTFGFGGADTPISRLARALSLTLFIGFVYCLMMAAIEARRSAARKGTEARDSSMGGASQAL